MPALVMAQAPIDDESDNFAIFDEPVQAPSTGPATKYDIPADDGTPLAKDDAPLGNNNNDTFSQIKALQQDIQELRSQLEMQARDLKRLQEQQLTFYKEMDSRLSSGNTAIGHVQPTIPTKAPLPTAVVKEPINKIIPSPPILPKNPLSNNPADEQIAYLAAYDLVKTKRYDEAVNAMQAFTVQYPRGAYTSNAEYWLGELYLIKKQYPESIEHFQNILKNYPTSSKVAASSLKLGYALAAAGRKQEARQQLESVVRKFPDTSVARLARAKLQSL
ncbi:MAG: tol-pal system protein YbgF [Legionellaceae bacterium]|nr:tol-pal system protein YbgF [Legionellaceae bacterium]